MTVKQKKAIVLCGDNGYIEKIATTIKSVCAHNDDIKFYIFNEDIPQEWFLLMNRRLEVLGSSVINVRIVADRIKQFAIPNEHINYATYFRYFIGDFVKEDRAIYLDSDMIVTRSLQPLFDLDLEGYPLGAVEDLPKKASSFNAGMLLVDVAYWRDNHLSQELLSLTAEIHERVFGDQGVLNHYFQGNWKPLELTYNLQVGSDYYIHLVNKSSEWYAMFKGIPTIIHYTLERKPWKEKRFNRFRDIWWFYYGLEWSEILLRHPVLETNFATLVKAPKVKTAIFTNSSAIAHLEKLLQRFPNVLFRVAAYTMMGEDLLKLQVYPNIELYQSIDPIQKKKIINEMDFYLDINHADEIFDMINTCKEKGTPIFSFFETSHDESDYSRKFSVDDLEGFVASLEAFIKENE